MKDDMHNNSMAVDRVIKSYYLDLSIIETVDLISTIPDDTLDPLPLSLAHNKQLYGHTYIYVYLLVLALKYLDLSHN